MGFSGFGKKPVPRGKKPTPLNPSDTSSNVDSNPIQNRNTINQHESSPSVTHPEKSLKRLREDSSFAVEDVFGSQIDLTAFESPIACVKFDSRGQRLYCGAGQSKVAVWEFATISSELKATAIFTIYEDKAAIKDIVLNPGENSFIAIGNGPQLNVTDLFGETIFTSPLGDKYLHDLSKTTGHVGTINGAAWHLSQQEIILSYSLDGTVRFFNTKERIQKKSQTNLIKFKTQTGKRLEVTSLSINLGAEYVVVGLKDGRIELYKSKPPYIRALSTDRKCHSAAVLSLSCANSHPDHVVSLCENGTIGLWQIKLGKLTCIQKSTSCRVDMLTTPKIAYAHDDSLILLISMSTSVSFLNPQTLDVVYQYRLPTTKPQLSILSCDYHPVLRQVALGLSNGKVSIFYSPTFSSKGVLIPLLKQPASEKQDVIANVDLTKQRIIAPFALKMFKEDYDPYMQKKQRAQKNKDIKNTIAPHEAVQASSGAARPQQVWKEHILKEVKVDSTRSENPRDAILKFADVSKQNPTYLGKAYQETQPAPLLMEKIYAKDSGNSSDSDNDN